MPKTLVPMEALSVDALPRGKDWVYEPKWDGFRCLAQRGKGGKVTLTSKSGKPLGRYFPDIVAMLEKIKTKDFTLDGELVIFTPKGLSFADLQLRLHPSASRIAKLAKEAPASLVLFDVLGFDGKNCVDEKFAARRKKLEILLAKFPAHKRLQLSPQTASLKTAQGWLKKMRGTIDGIVAKNIGDRYEPGERVMQKFKPVKTADCVVGGFRYGTGSDKVGSLLLGLYDGEGKLNHVGFTSAIAAADKPKLTKKLERLKGKAGTGFGFTGKAPGGPSRWSTERSAQWEALKPSLVVEVSFDHVSDDRFRHGTKLLRFRPDKKPAQCGMEQLEV